MGTLNLNNLNSFASHKSEIRLNNNMTFRFFPLSFKIRLPGGGIIGGYPPIGIPAAICGGTPDPYPPAAP